VEDLNEEQGFLKHGANGIELLETAGLQPCRTKMDLLVKQEMND
jgi:hypothetical protein